MNIQDATRKTGMAVLGAASNWHIEIIMSIESIYLLLKDKCTCKGES